MNSEIVEIRSVVEKKTTHFILPNDIIAEILSRLDIKSRTQFKCVCKSWQYLLSDDPSFKNMQLKHEIPCILFAPHRFRRSCPRGRIMFSYGGFGQISKFRLPKVESGSSLIVEGSDKGILCLSEYSTNTTIHLWNPTTREVKTLPSPICHFWEFSKFRVGFGYDTLTNDFKAVRVSRPLFPSEHIDNFRGSVFDWRTKVLVYSLRSNSWKRIKWPNIILHSFDLKHDCSVVVNGSVHWMILYDDDFSDTKLKCLNLGIVAFDLNTEVFKLMKVPKPRACIDLHFIKSLGKLSECLSFIYCDTPRLIEIYKMKEYGVSDSWIKQVIDLSHCSLKWSPSLKWSSSQNLHVPREKFKPIAIGNNGYILCSVSHGLFCYNPNNSSLEYVCPKMDVVGFTNYVESDYLLKVSNHNQ